MLPRTPLAKAVGLLSFYMRHRLYAMFSQFAWTAEHRSVRAFSCIDRRAIMRKLTRAIALFASMLALAQFSGAAAAAVTRLEMSSTTPYGSFKAGAYTRWDALVVGELSPAAEPIPDLDKALRNARGRVEYSTRLTVIAPADPARANGALLIDVPNRGRAISSSLYNSPRRMPVPPGSLDEGNGFLQNYGYTIAVVYWELGQGVALPVFTGADGEPRSIEGAAFAIVRDVADFLAHASADSAGQRNPLAGTITRTLALGYSQTGRFLKSFLLRGFNLAEGRRVFAGMHILGAGAGHIVLRSIPGAASGAGAIPTFDDPELRGVNEEPLALSDLVQQARLPADVVPRMVFVNTTTDYFSLRASLARTGGDGARDKALPANVRVYDIAGASHALITGTELCKYPYALLDWHPVMRATLLALDRWVAANTPPPPSELMPLREAAGDSMALRAPAHLPRALILIPVLDRDGNATGGVRLPDMAVPLGTHAAQNPPLSPVCSLAAAYVAFAKTRAARDAAQDARASLAERYKNRNDYANRIRAAARELERRDLLLTEDAAIIVRAAAAGTVMK